MKGKLSDYVERKAKLSKIAKKRQKFAIKIENKKNFKYTKIEDSNEGY